MSLFKSNVGFLIDVIKDYRSGEEQFNFGGASVYEVDIFHVWKICDCLHTVILRRTKFLLIWKKLYQNI